MNKGSSRSKKCHESFDVTADLPSLILLSIELHVLLSLFDWWAYQESDADSVL